MSGSWQVLSLFTGIGGIDLGLQRAGMTIAGQVEIDPWCRTILEKHWPEVPRHDDVRTAAGWWGSRPVDLVCGGFPCQPVSLAGRGLAQADPRWLWPAFADVVRDLRPRFVLVENTPGLLGRGMGDVLGDLAGLGYDAEWDCISAAHFDAPHLRERIWIVAYPRRGGVRGRGSAGVVPGTPGTGEGEEQERERLRADAGHGRPVVADAADDRAGRRRQQQQAVSEGARHVADADGSGLGKRRRTEPVRAELATTQRCSQTLADASRIGRGEGPRIFRRMGTEERRRWLPEPRVGRVAHGIPRRVDRLRGLGNAVVPQVVEHIGRLIIEADAAR